MRFDPLGEAAFILRELGESPPFAIANALNDASIPGLIEANAAYDSVGIYVNPTEFDQEHVRRLIDGFDPAEVESKTHRIPVCYEMGEDLQQVAADLSLNPAQVVELHCSSNYRCFAIGFSPGFPYLGYLPEPLCGIMRRPEPRVSVPAGSVAIVGNQTAVYPTGTPGGWALIGLTPLTLVDVADAYFPISAGDEVGFERIDELEFQRLKGVRL